jgi:alpha-1,2-mannosyltransferase
VRDRSSLEKVLAGDALLWAVLAAGATFYLWWAAAHDLTDSAVYIAGGRAIRAHQPLYALRTADTHLPFTYPPFAALLFTVLTLAPARAIQVLWTAGSLALAAVIVRHSVERFTGAPWRGATRWLLVAVLAADPARVNLTLGQINFLTALLVIDDLTGPPDRRWRGAGVGLAAAIKLTPLYFIAYFAATRRLRAASVALATFAAAVLVGFALDPADTRAYWSGIVLDAPRAGGVAYASNQSLAGVALRLVREPSGARLLWLALAFAATVAFLAYARRHHPRRARDLDAGAMALSLLASPISWAHHFIFALPLVLSGFRVAAEARSRWRFAAAAVFAAALEVGTIWLVPRGHEAELHHGPLEFLACNSYALLAALALAALLVERRGAPPAPPG